MHGRLSEHPLAELISEISEKRISGALRIEHERVKAVVYFEEGQLVFATSNLRSHRLAEYLRQQGVADPVVNETVSDTALAEDLLTRAVLTRARLDELTADWVTSVMRMLLLWTDGAWSFDGRAHPGESSKTKVATAQLLLQAARRIELEFASSRFPNGGEALSPGSASHDGLMLLPTEAFLLSRVEGSISLNDLIAIGGLREPEAKQVIYGLVLARLLQREYQQPAFRTPPPQTTRPTSAKSEPDKTEPAPPQPVKPIAQPVIDPMQELHAFIDRLVRASDHYEVLNISPSAELAEIKREYHNIARNFHPDRFHELAGSVTHTRLQSCFARVTQAYETLTNPESRSLYDANIQAVRRVRESQEATARADGGANRASNSEKTEGGDSVAQLAEKRFQEGAVALQQGQTNAATACFSAAARLAPNEPKYRAYFGRTLAANPKTRREAESELQAAVKLAPNNASYHVMLAVLYRDLGFAKRAASEGQRALALDPQNSQARQLLSTLEK
jgi:curved DNA-binding protein CbpA